MAVMTKGFIEGILPDELMKLLLSLATNWGDVIDMDKFKVVHMSGAMTNEVYRISWPTKIDNIVRTVLVRVYGEGVDVFFDRDAEIQTFENLSVHGHGPRLLGQFSGGRVEEFIHARTLSAVDLRDPELSAMIATKLRDFHNLEMPGTKNVLLWDRMRNWIVKAKKFCAPELAKEFSLDKLDEELRTLEIELSQDNKEIGFCHNDLQYGNIMFNEKTKLVTIIDYEYASYNPIAYDLANHFCEMAANYHTETPHKLDYSIYPDYEERKRFVRAYLSSTGNEPSDSDVESLVKNAERHILPNHLFWGLWGVISAYVNNIDFDYMEYARQRFQQYWLRKPQILG